MKKMLLVVALLGVFVFSASAGFNANVFGGYTTVSMAKLNDLLKNANDFYSSYPGVERKLTKSTQGFLVGGEFGFSPIPGLSIGPRVEFIGGMFAEFDVTDTATGYYSKVKFTNYLLPIMGGATFMVALPQLPISVGGGVYLGYGIAGGSEKMDVNYGTPSSVEVSTGGGTFVTDINLNADMDFGPITGGLILGYRIANVAEMRAIANNVSLGIKKGDLLTGSDGKALPFDYSGFVAGLNFSIGF